MDNTITASLQEHNIRIRMRKTVRPTFAFLSKADTFLLEGEEYPAVSNIHGAISGICENGELLGVKPGEFEFVDAPGWVLDIWKHAGIDNYKEDKQ